MKSNSKQTIEQKIVDFAFNLYNKKHINSDGVASRRVTKDRYFIELRGKPFMESIKFQRVLEIIKKYDLILDDKAQGKLQFKIDNIIKSKADMEAQLKQMNIKKPKKNVSEVILSSPESVELAYVTTFKQFIKKFIPTSKSCAICKLKFTTETEFVVHFNEHGELFMIRALKSTYKIERMFGITIEIDKKASTIVFGLENNFGQLLTITEIFLYTSIGLVSILSEKSKKMEPKDLWTIPVSKAILSIPNNKYSLLIKSENAVYEFIEQYHVTMKKPLNKQRNIVLKSNLSDVPLKFRKLHDYPVTNCIQNLFKNGFEEKGVSNKEEKILLDQIQKYITETVEARLHKENYVTVLNIMNQIEDFELISTYKRYTVKNAELKACHTNKFYVLQSSQFEVEPTRLSADDKVIITVERAKGPDQMIEGVIDCIVKGDIVIWTENPVKVDQTINVEFLLNRFPFIIQYQALMMLKDQNISQLFFPESPPDIKTLTIRKFNWFNHDISTNLEQKTAIQNIVNDTSFPSPYILFGPPGTGKTSTLVEAICQIYKLKPKAHILVTAETNYACNEVANRLLKYLSQKDIFRFFSRSSEKLIKELTEDLLDSSNLDAGSYRIPFQNEIYGFRIVICTLTTSGRLIQAGIRSNLFEYIFIDECGSAKEVASLIPLSGLATSRGKNNAKIILAGDPKQLGPVIFNSMATKMGLNISMLERLMSHKIYRKDPETKQYNNQLITKLLENYRSHKAILQFSNENFYDGELKAMAKAEITDWALNWKKLPNKEFPIIFHCIFGKSQRDKQSASLFNREELQMVKSYLESIFKNGIKGKVVNESDVGVISPYAKQVSRIKEICNNNKWKNIQVGSTEQFQGREKKVMIFSTVRSETKTVGFLNNEKRLNVALTRAKSLLVVIGNPKTLKVDENWKKFIDYCVQHGALRGVPSVEPKKDVPNDLVDGIKNISLN